MADMKLFSALALLSLAACSGEAVIASGGSGGGSSSSAGDATTGPGASGGGSSTSTTGPGATSTSASSSSGGSVDGWTTLIDGTWQLAAGSEGYWCTLKTIKEDTYISSFRAQAPQGTHHTLLIRMDGSQPDGEAACGPTLGANMVHASGVGSDDLVFPDGVGVKIPAGTQLLLNLHLFNTSDQPISGVSGTLIKTIAPADLKQEAEMVLGGSTAIDIPPEGTQTVIGGCTFPAQATLITVWPHMHMYGTHMKIAYEGPSGDQVLHDGPYSFGEQTYYPISPLVVGAGQRIRIECSYANNTTETVSWGDSSTAEMCFAGLYRYPALGTACSL